MMASSAIPTTQGATRTIVARVMIASFNFTFVDRFRFHELLEQHRYYQDQLGPREDNSSMG
jgi:hypothetical protein